MNGGIIYCSKGHWGDGRVDEDLSFGQVNFVMPIKNPSNDVKHTV